MTTTTTLNDSYGPQVLKCRGANHHDHGTLAVCDDCGRTVVRLESGRILTPHLNDRGNYAYYCFSTKRHECDPEWVALYAAEKAAKVESGEILKNSTVEVFKGRKVPVGTVGIVKWIGEDNYGTEKVGLKVEGQDKLVYTAKANVRVK